MTPVASRKVLNNKYLKKRGNCPIIFEQPGPEFDDMLSGPPHVEFSVINIILCQIITFTAVAQPKMNI